MYKTFTTALGALENRPTALAGEGDSPFGAVRYQRGESHRRWLIDVMLFKHYDTEK